MRDYVDPKGIQRIAGRLFSLLWLDNVHADLTGASRNIRRLFMEDETSRSLVIAIC